MRIDVAFSAVLDPLTVTSDTFVVSTSNGSPVAGAVVTSASVATFVPAATLLSGHRYTARVLEGIRSETGEPLSAERSWNFTTDSGIPLIAFQAYQSETQSFSSADSGAWIRFQTEVADQGSHFAFDAGVGAECFTVPEAGVYSFTYGLGKEQAIDTILSLSLWNGTTGIIGYAPQIWCGQGGGWRSNGAWTGSLAAGQKICVRGATSDPTSRPTENLPANTFFSGFRVR